MTQQFTGKPKLYQDKTASITFDFTCTSWFVRWARQDALGPQLYLFLAQLKKKKKICLEKRSASVCRAELGCSTKTRKSKPGKSARCVSQPLLPLAGPSFFLSCSSSLTAAAAVGAVA